MEKRIHHNAKTFDGIIYLFKSDDYYSIQFDGVKGSHACYGDWLSSWCAQKWCTQPGQEKIAISAHFPSNQYSFDSVCNHFSFSVQIQWGKETRSVMRNATCVCWLNCAAVDPPSHLRAALCASATYSSGPQQAEEKKEDQFTPWGSIECHENPFRSICGVKL